MTEYFVEPLQISLVLIFTGHTAFIENISQEHDYVWFEITQGNFKGSTQEAGKK